MREVQPGLSHWEAPHPDWEPGCDWPEVVSSYALDTGDTLVLIDPLAVPEAVLDQAAGRETAIVLTCPWHARDAPRVAERLDAPLWVPPPDEGDADPVTGRVYRAGQRLPVGVQAFAGMEPNDLVLWIESHRALVTGDTLIDRGEGLIFPSDWANKGVPAAEILQTLRPLLTLPVEIVLPTHGQPTDRDALVHALG